jgi:phenol 2-monooxygenase
MQFHLNGFRPGDPELVEPAQVASRTCSGTSLPATVDVLIVGCGPAGLTLAAQLSAFPSIETRIVEQKTGPLELGQADGIACRTMEMFEAFGFAERVLKEAYWVNETVFWGPEEERTDTIVRRDRIQDTEDGLSEFPHVILNQARIHDFFLDVMRKSPTRLEPDYGRTLVDLKLDRRANPIHPVTATLERRTDEHECQIETVKARYVVGCDGARSAVRQLIGRQLVGDSANQAWGVMDVLAVTDFPDVRFKSLIRSAREGSLLIIPREGGYLARFYIELDKLNENERVANRNISSNMLVAAAQRILHPYSLDVKEIAWWSVYEIGQRLCDKFDDVPAAEVESRLPHVFIAGDACHTHSPKAGQGMNVSMRDSFNLGWKLAAVLEGRSPPKLLHTYSAERQRVARELIDFDRVWAQMMSARPAHEGNAGADAASNGFDPVEFQSYFEKHARFTAGTSIQYHASEIVGPQTHQDLAKGLVIGMRFHSARVIRLADAKPVQLGHTVKADGRWRLFAFANAEDTGDAESGIGRLCTFLEESPASPIRLYTPAHADIDAVIDVRAIFQQYHRNLSLERMPSSLFPGKGVYGLRDYEKIFCADHKSGEDIFEMRGIDRRTGCMVIVRPDQHIAHVLPLEAYDGLIAFFGGFMTPSL